MDSILTSIKKMLGIDEEDENFDVDVKIHINSAISILTQIGFGPVEGFSIKDKTNEWPELIGDTQKHLDLIKSYIYMKVKLIFDPPTVGPVLTALKDEIKQYEYRIRTAVESNETE